MLSHEGRQDAENGFVQMEVEMKGEVSCWEEIQLADLEQHGLNCADPLICTFVLINAVV